MLTRANHDLTMADAARNPGGARVDLLLVAEMVTPGAKVIVSDGPSCPAIGMSAAMTVAIFG